MYHWVLVASNGKVVCKSESFSSKEAVYNGIQLNRKLAYTGIVEYKTK